MRSDFEIEALGTIQVPNDFHWVTWMLKFVENHHKRSHFDIPERVVADEPTNYVFSGDKIKVSVVRQQTERVSTNDRLRFLNTNNSLLLGSLGAGLVLEYLFEELPAGIDIYSFDHPNHLRKKYRESGFSNTPPESLLPKVYKGVCESPFFYFEESIFNGDSVWDKNTLFFHYTI